jgi:DUF971 family protein
MPLPLDIRKKPTDVKVQVSTGAGVEIKWSDGHASHYDFSYLRENCPCATCKEEHERHHKVEAGNSAGAGVLPMFKPKVSARAASAVGGYAIQIEFTDGHSTGIYSFDHLREICPCDACAREFRLAHTP